jgi:hypothetical protein
VDAAIHAKDLCAPWLARCAYGRPAARAVAFHCVATDLFASDILGYYTRYLGPLASVLPLTPRAELLHFGSLFTTAAVAAQWASLERATAAAVAEGSAAWRLAVLGASLHAVHDFYAHSNWGRVEWQAHGLDAPIWHDMPRALLARLDVHTATGHGIVPPPGRFTHTALNADHPGRPGFEVAFAAADKATGAWLARCRAWAGDGWAAMLAHPAPGIEVDYDRLRELAEAAGHWRGSAPVQPARLLAGALRFVPRLGGEAARQWLVRGVGRRLVA